MVIYDQANAKQFAKILASATDGLERMRDWRDYDWLLARIGGARFSDLKRFSDAAETLSVAHLSGKTIVNKRDEYRERQIR